jgi:speckle-type POZ protein
MSCFVVGSGDANSASAIVAQAAMGSHVLKIDWYSRTMGLGNDNFVKSRPFVIGGHPWCIRYYPDVVTNDRAGWIEFYLHLNQNNATVAEASYTFSLLDDVGEPVPSYCLSDGIIRSFNNSTSNGWGYLKFIERKALEESDYLKDDCFRARCDVTVSTEIHTEGASQFVTVPPSDMNQHIGRLLSSGVEGLEADVTFQVGEETFAAHRLMLGARSSVFLAELLGPMKERNSRVVQIDDMEPRVFRAMLHFIYTDEFPKLDKGDALAMAQHLLVTADRYDLQRQKLICEHKLCECISTSSATTTLVLAEQHGCKGLKEACFKFHKSPCNLKKIMYSDEFQHLTSSCPSLLDELLANVVP